MTQQLIDTALDRTVVGGYTSVGYRVRAGAWADREMPRVDGRTVAITGASSGIGLAAAEAFAGLGATVVLLVRTVARGEQARAAILGRVEEAQISIAVCDLASLASVRACAAGLIRDGEPLHVLVNNAGVLAPQRTLTEDGIELTFATNVVGPFLLTNLLAQSLAASAPARIINVSSGGMYTQRLHIEDLQSERDRFDGAVAYARTKRAQVILTELWAQRFGAGEIAVHAMHPGWVNTPGVQSSLPRFYRVAGPLLRTPAQGADTIVWLGAAARGELGTGRFWHDRRPRPTHLLPWTRERPEDRERLWNACAALSGWRHSRTPELSPRDPERGL